MGNAAVMTDDPMREMFQLLSINGFYLSILETTLGFSIPTPKWSTEDVPDPPAQHSINVLTRWLGLLDLAITPLMIRDALRDVPQDNTPEALIHYYVGKSTHSELDRDKADCVVTSLYRKWAAAGQVAQHDAASLFEEHLQKLLGNINLPLPNDEQSRLVHEFDFLRQEVEDFRHFDAIMDSGIVQRVRDLKQKLGSAFYHPSALAAIAVYNVLFGHRFDELFRQATAQIKGFAAKAQQEGASIMSRVDGDVMVKQLAEVEETASLRLEYGRAQEQFRKISRYKKAVDKRLPARPASFASGPIPPVETTSGSGTMAARSPAANSDAVEESRIQATMDTIRDLTRFTDHKGAATIVAMPSGNLVLAPQEVEAFRADFRKEKSFRADYANSIARIIALQQRIQSELKHYAGKKTSQHLWKPHADAIAYLQKCARQELEGASKLLDMCEQRGLTEKSATMKGTVEKLTTQMNLIQKQMES